MLPSFPVVSDFYFMLYIFIYFIFFELCSALSFCLVFYILFLQTQRAG